MTIAMPSSSKVGGKGIMLFDRPSGYPSAVHIARDAILLYSVEGLY